MAVDRNRRSNWNDPFLQTCPLGAGRRGQREIPELAIRAYFHRRMRSGQADPGLDRAREFEFLILVSSPTVMGRCRKSRKRKSENTKPNAKRESRIHGDLSLTPYDTTDARAVRLQNRLSSESESPPFEIVLSCRAIRW